MVKEFDRKIVLDDGEEYYGYAFGASGDKIAEIVFNTSMAGYQEILSDPSYTNQAVVMTYPLIGNYGIADEDFETKTPSISALIVREVNDFPSNFRYTKTLSEIMEENGIVGISGIDTRSLTRSIRDEGSRKALITSVSTPKARALALLSRTEIPTDAVAQVSCKKRWYSRTANPQYNVVAVDCGIKLNIVRMLNKRGCNVTVVPYTMSAAEILAMRPDGVLLSNGPGSPEDVPEVVELIRELRGQVPMMGIGLGHQLLAIAYGATVAKLPFGHHGGYPVKNLLTDKIEITSQNHMYVVTETSMEHTPLTLTHVNLIDDTVAGVKCDEDGVFGVQFQPESAPGAQDSEYLFDVFVEEMKEKKHG